MTDVSQLKKEVQGMAKKASPRAAIAVIDKKLKDAVKEAIATEEPEVPEGTPVEGLQVQSMNLQQVLERLQGLEDAREEDRATINTLRQQNEQLQQELNSRPVILSSTRSRGGRGDDITELGLNSGEALILLERKYDWPRRYITRAWSVRDFLGKDEG